MKLINKVKNNNTQNQTISKFLNETNNIQKCNEKFILDNSENKEVLIEVKNLKKSFNNNKNQVLKGINLTFYKGENVALLGGNGAGKTTFIEILAGLNKSDSGNITYNLDYKNTFQEKIGIQFQDSSYPKGITVKRVIKFVREIYNSDISDKDLESLVHIFGINEFYKKRASSLSGGQSQRLNCLLAILHKPKFLILDELSTGLDITIRNKIKAFIKIYAQENNINILLVSHNMDEVEYLTNRIILFKKGEIFVDAPIDKINEKFGSLQKMIELYV